MIGLHIKQIKKNHILFAIKGNKFDENKFIPHAIRNGSRIIVSENKSDKYKNGILFINKKNIRKLLAEVSSKIYNKKPKNIIDLSTMLYNFSGLNWLVKSLIIKYLSRQKLIIMNTYYNCH